MCKLLILGITLLTLISPRAIANEVTITLYTNKADWEASLSGSIIREDFSNDQLVYSSKTVPVLGESIIDEFGTWLTLNSE